MVQERNERERTTGRGLRSERGFTFIEIMVVVAILAILAALVIPRSHSLQLRLAAQFPTSVTTTGALTVVRLCDFAIVLGHVISSIWYSW